MAVTFAGGGREKEYIVDSVIPLPTSRHYRTFGSGVLAGLTRNDLAQLRQTSLQNRTKVNAEVRNRIIQAKLVDDDGVQVSTSDPQADYWPAFIEWMNGNLKPYNDYLILKWTKLIAAHAQPAQAQLLAAAMDTRATGEQNTAELNDFARILLATGQVAHVSHTPIDPTTTPQDVLAAIRAGTMIFLTNPRGT